MALKIAGMEARWHLHLISTAMNLHLDLDECGTQNENPKTKKANSQHMIMAHVTKIESAFNLRIQ